MIRALIILISCHLFIAPAFGQDSWREMSSDEIFMLAREKAFNGNREEARQMLRFVLAKSPDYHDVRILLGRTYAWDGQRAEARKELQYVLTKSPNHEDGLNALVDVEMWDDQLEEALKVTERALEIYPTHEDFLFKRAKIFNNLANQNEAILILNRLLLINPSHQQGLDLLSSIKTGRLRYTAGVSYSYDMFSRTFDPAHYASTQLGRSNRWGTSIVRFNFAHRFETSGVQPEIDLYPRIVDGVYAYLNYGYSSTALFPDHRVGAEIFTKLPKSFEASGGLRFLYFDRETKVTIFTGSVGWYFKSYWLSLRPYITPDKETGTSYSATLFLRRYFNNSDHYIGISSGMGFSPDERRFQSGSGFTSDGIYVLKSQRGGLSWSKTMKHNFMFQLNIDLSRQELIFDQGNYVLITSFGTNLRKRF